jgi:general secretion pathway protein I
MKRQRGFTLLEILVASAIMGLAVAGVMGGLAASTRTTARLTQYDRAAMLARTKMDELLADHEAPRNAMLQGRFVPLESGGVDAGWQARVVPFEAVSDPTPGTYVVERVDLEVWWIDDRTRRSFSLEGIRRSFLPVQ